MVKRVTHSIIDCNTFRFQRPTTRVLPDTFFLVSTPYSKNSRHAIATGLLTLSQSTATLNSELSSFLARGQLTDHLNFFTLDPAPGYGEGEAAAGRFMSDFVFDSPQTTPYQVSYHWNKMIPFNPLQSVGRPLTI
jgi:hypothetical protein